MTKMMINNMLDTAEKKPVVALAITGDEKMINREMKRVKKTTKRIRNKLNLCQ